MGLAMVDTVLTGMYMQDRIGVGMLAVSFQCSNHVVE